MLVIVSVSDSLVVPLCCVLFSYTRLSGRCADAASRWSWLPCWYAINCLVLTVVRVGSCWRCCHADSVVDVHECEVVSVRGGCIAEGMVSVRLLVSCGVGRSDV